MDAAERIADLTERAQIRRASRLPGAEIAYLPVLPAFDDLLPEPGLRRGTTVATSGVGATSLALALAAGPSQDGAWCAAVGVRGLHPVAVSEAGVALSRLTLVPGPDTAWPDVLAALVDAFDVVLTAPGLSARDTRRVAGRVRERGCVLIGVGGWPESELRLRGASAGWEGADDGHGHLRSRRIEVTVDGRRAAARPRTRTLWLPDRTGMIAAAERERISRIG